MKILLVRPITPRKMVLNVIPPIGLGYLATALRKAGFPKIKILDCVKGEINYNDFAEKIREFSPDVVGLQIFSHDLPSLIESARIIKTYNSKTVIIVGGPHPSGFPKQILKDFPAVDFAFKGESEIGFPLLIRHLKENTSYKQIPGLIWRDSKHQIIVNSQIFPENLDDLGIPAWDLLRPDEYPDAPQGIFFKNLPIAPIMVTRGCPYQCTFCAGHTITGRKIRVRSVGHVLSEIKLLYEKYGVREIHILDDNFTFDCEYVKKFCSELLQMDFRISWCCPNGIRLDSLDKEVLKLMKASGCYYVSVGIESGSDRILALMKKGLTREKIIKQIDLIKSTGMDVNGFFILGYPGETKKEMESTIKFSQQLGLKRAAFYNFLPLPGTEIYNFLHKKGEISSEKADWGSLFQADVPYSPKSVSKKELKNLQKKAYCRFYFRPATFFSLMKEIKTFNQLKYLARRTLVYLGENLV